MQNRSSAEFNALIAAVPNRSNRPIGRAWSMGRNLLYDPLSWLTPLMIEMTQS